MTLFSSFISTLDPAMLFSTMRCSRHTIVLSCALFLCSFAQNTRKLEADSSLFAHSDSIKVTNSVFAIAAIVAGLVIGLAGQRFARPTMFVCAFAMGGLALSGLVTVLFRHSSWIETGSWVSFVIGGLIAAGLVFAVLNFGIFMIGALAGVLLACTINNMVGYRIYPSDPTMFLVILAIVLAIAGGFLAFKAERLALVVVTSAIGAHVVVWGIGYFAGGYPNPFDLKAFAVKTDGMWVYSVSSVWWAYLTASLLLFSLFLYVQLKKTSKI